MVGYAITIGTTDVHAKYATCFLVIMGGITVPILVAWATENAAPDTVRATTAGIVPSIGGLGSDIAV